MQHSSSRQCRKHFVCRIAAHIRSKCYRMLIFRHISQMCSMRVIYNEPCIIFAAYFRYRCYISNFSGIVRRCEIYAAFFAAAAAQCGCCGRRTYFSGKQTAAVLRHYPIDFKVKERGGVKERSMSVPRGEYSSALAFHNCKHSLYAKS